MLAERARGRLTVTIRDDGVGLPAGFAREGTDRLGLQIVRTLVSAELDGTIEIRARRTARPGTEAVRAGARSASRHRESRAA